MHQRVEIRLPNLDVSGVPIAVSVWHAAVGQKVIEGDRLVEILAGDVIVDLPAPASGVLAEKCVEIEQPLSTGQVLGVIKADED